MSREKPKPVEAKHDAGRPGSPGEAQEPPARAAAYIPPMAVPKESRYHTIDMKAVRLSPDIDPKRMKTQLSLRAIQAATVRPPSRIPAWIALLCAGGAVGTAAWWFLRWQHVNEQTTSNAVTTVATDVVVVVSPGAVSPVTHAPTATGETPVVGASPEAASREATAPVVTATSVPVAANSEAPAAALTAAALAPAPAVAPAATRSSRGRVRSSGVKVQPAPRNQTAPASGPVPEASASSASQPKLWLE